MIRSARPTMLVIGMGPKLLLSS
ncbi:MAG: hypothetical protein JWN30_1934, partial [Bacilli bacterium]|nr:hypothetical protein [Bacilli bacterium]